MNPTERLTFEQLTSTWVQDIFRCNTGNVKRYFYDFDSEEEARVWVAEAVELARRSGKKEFVILAEGEFAGLISPEVRAGGTGTIGLWIAEDKQGKGYAKEALRSATEYLKDQGVVRVAYEVEKDNEASLKLIESLGGQPVAEDDKYKKFIFDLLELPIL